MFRAAFNIVGATWLVVACLACGESSSVHLLWRFATPENATASWQGVPATANGRVFVAAGHDIIALDAERGKLLWRTQIRTRTALATKHILERGGALYLVDSTVMSLDAASGAIRWRMLIDSAYGVIEHAIDDQSLYIGTRGDHRVIALDPATGAERWRTDVGPSWTFPGFIRGLSLSGDTLYASVIRYLNQFGGLSTGAIAALDRNTGQLLWIYETPETHDDVNSAPVVAGRFLLASDLAGGAFFAVDRFTRERVWRVAGPANLFGPHAKPVVVGSNVYVGSNDKNIYKVELETGKVLWKIDVGGSIGQFSVCRNTAFAQDFNLAAVDLDSGRFRFRQYFSGEEFPTSGFAQTKDRIFVAGPKAVYSFSCP